MKFDINDYGIGKRPFWAIFASLIVFAALAVYIFGNVAFGEGSRILPVYSVETPEKKVAITFNCAWKADDIPEILEVLERYEAKATFFILGQWAKENPSAVEMIAKAGHEIGTHSNTHPDMAKISMRNYASKYADYKFRTSMNSTEAYEDVIRFMAKL